MGLFLDKEKCLFQQRLNGKRQKDVSFEEVEVKKQKELEKRHKKRVAKSKERRDIRSIIDSGLFIMSKATRYTPSHLSRVELAEYYNSKEKIRKIPCIESRPNLKKGRVDHLMHLRERLPKPDKRCILRITQRCLQAKHIVKTYRINHSLNFRIPVSDPFMVMRKL